ncbi:hypothetical protein DFH29DRAFT_211407 [Suillus ampliporus]|nr:hypothetical protein DFH29DRAFT_211407 [Suillus ampliporus]
MGLMRSRLRDSSVTSLSNTGSEFSNEKPRMSLRQPLAVRASNEDEDAMDVDRPPRSSSALLQPAKSGLIAVQSSASHVNNLNLPPRARQIIGPSSITSFSTPVLPTTSGAGGAFFEGEDPISRTSSNPSSDELLSPPRGFESGGSADMEAGSGKSSQVSSESEENVASSRKAKIGLKMITTIPAINAVPGQATTTEPSRMPKQFKLTGISKAKSSGPPVPSLMPPVPELVEEKIPDAKLVPSELDQRAAGHAVIDYKLPRQLHQDLSPSPLMAHANPIWTVVQDMREQRMSLCQSLRQYVFVHAAVIEGALMMVDEERELWGESTGSEGSPEPAGASNISEEGRRSEDDDMRKTPSMNMGGMEISGMGRPQGSRDRTRSFPAFGGQSSASSVVSSSPSKWKRGPSPTELLREDKSGIVSFAKRPSFKRRIPSDEQILTVFDLTAGAPQALPSGTDGVSQVESRSTTHMDVGPMAPEQGGSSAQ